VSLVELVELADALVFKAPIKRDNVDAAAAASTETARQS
jgi:hypothetical protein